MDKKSHSAGSCYGPYSSAFEDKDLHYVMKVLEKKRLLSEETRKALYKALGDCYGGNEIFPEAKKYYLMAGREDLVAQLNKKREQTESICCSFDHYKNN